MQKGEKIMLTLWEKKFSRCIYDCQDKFLKGECFGDIDIEGFQELGVDLFSSANRRQLSKMLLDTSGMKNDRATPIHQLFPIVSQTQLKYLAIVLPKGEKQPAVALQNPVNTKQETVNINYFECPQEGLNWLIKTAS